MSREELEARIKSFDYWHYPIDLGNGVVINAESRNKLTLRDFIWPAVLDLCGGTIDGFRVLDVGCNAGFWSFEAHRSGAAYVLGVDARPVHIEQAEFVRETLGVDPTRVEFRRMNICDLSRNEIGEYDLCLLLRVLHHLSHPLLGLEKIREVCRNYLVLDVKLFTKVDRPVFYVHAEDPTGVLHGVDGLALRPSRSALELVLKSNGFTSVCRVPPIPALGHTYASGKRAVFTARVATEGRGVPR